MKTKFPLMLVALASAAIGGCSTTPADVSGFKNAVVVSDDEMGKSQDLVCRKRAPTGTRLKETTCMTRDELAAERQRAQETIRRSVKRSLALMSSGRMN